MFPSLFPALSSTTSRNEGALAVPGGDPLLLFLALTFQALLEVSEPGLPQGPEDGQALCWPVLLGAQHLQVLWEDRTR